MIIISTIVWYAGILYKETVETPSYNLKWKLENLGYRTTKNLIVGENGW